ncbi:hypothetical protein Ancab_008244 [Ancistrocladus abbreviatus]
MIFSKGLDREKASRSVDEKQMLPFSSVVLCSLEGFRCSRGGALPHTAGERVREGYVSPLGERSTKDIKGDETEVIMRREEEGCAARSARSARTKSLDLRQKTDFSLGNSNATGPTIFRSKKELVYKDQSLCMAWAADPVIVGYAPAHSECNRSLNGCPVKLKTKRAYFSRKQKKSKQRGSSKKTSENANEQGGMKAGKAQISGTSLSDINIENMNRLFLLKL